MAGSPNLDGAIGNIFSNSHIVSKETLLLLKNSLVAAQRVWRVPEKYFTGGEKKGSVISIRKPSRVKSTEGRVITDHNAAVEETTPFNIDRQQKISFETAMVDKTLSIRQFMDDHIRPGIIQIANEVDASVLLSMQEAFWSYGTPGNAVSYTDWHNARAIQTRVGVPDDGMRSSIESPETCAAVNIGLGVKPNDPFSDQAIKRGYMGNLAGYERFESNNLPMHESGAFGANDGTIQVDGAGQGSDGTITIKGAPTSTTGVVKKGDVFTITGVYSVNPQTYQNSGMLQHFVVQADADSDGAGAVVVSVSPSMNDGTVTTTNPDGDTITLDAYQNVTNYPADSAPVTFIGTEQSTWRQDFLFHKQAVGLAVVPMAVPESAVVKERVTDQDSGLSLLMTAGYEPMTNSEICRVDVLWGTKMLYPDLGLRLMGGA